MKLMAKMESHKHANTSRTRLQNQKHQKKKGPRHAQTCETMKLMAKMESHKHAHTCTKQKNTKKKRTLGTRSGRPFEIEPPLGTRTQQEMGGLRATHCITTTTTTYYYLLLLTTTYYYLLRFTTTY